MTTYQNPVSPGYFADPFVLKVGEEYYAYGTAPERPANGRIFPVLHSRDLVHWTALGGALEVPAGADRTAYWAPEAAERDGKFYLYYSAASGPDETHRLYAAVADHPAGPFREAGPLLPGSSQFAIDAHPFFDPVEGRWYLLFATDFFDARPGTALAGLPLADDMVSAAGPVVTLLRASHDWQIYERHRPLYGQVFDAWHTLEGPTLRFHDGCYVLLYSGGNWHGETYGGGLRGGELGPRPVLGAGSRAGSPIRRCRAGSGAGPLLGDGRAGRGRVYGLPCVGHGRHGPANVH